MWSNRRKRMFLRSCRTLVLLLTVVYLLQPHGVVLAVHTGWGQGVEGTLPAMRMAFSVAVTEKAILQTKLESLTDLSSTVSDRLMLLRVAGSPPDGDQNKRLGESLDKLNAANEALDGVNARLAAARENYSAVLARRDARGTALALTELADAYDEAGKRADDVDRQLKSVLTLLKAVPVVPPPTPTPTPDGAQQTDEPD